MFRPRNRNKQNKKVPKPLGMSNVYFETNLWYKAYRNLWNNVEKEIEVYLS